MNYIEFHARIGNLPINRGRDRPINAIVAPHRGTSSRTPRARNRIDLLFFRLGTDAAAGRNGITNPNRFVFCNDNRSGDRFLDHVDDRVLDWHLHRGSWCLSCCSLRRRLFLGCGFRGSSTRTDLGLRLFGCRVLCGFLACRLGACLAAFRDLLARRNALLCFGHRCPL
jgi:hypothetical protein